LAEMKMGRLSGNPFALRMKSVDGNGLELSAALFVLECADVARDQGPVVAVQGKIGACGCDGIRGNKVERRQRVHDKGVAGIV
jgi:hypothetical protein